MPAAFTSFIGFYMAMFCSIGYLIRKDLRLDAVAAAITEVSFAFAIHHPGHRYDLGPRHLGHLVDLGSAPHLLS